MRRLGADSLDAHQLESAISAKLDATYIYSIRFREAYNVSQFNMILEHESAAGRYRYTAGFKYLGPEEGVELVTLF